MKSLFPVYNPSKCPNGPDGCSSCGNLKVIEAKLQAALDTVTQLLTEHYTQRTVINQRHSLLVRMMPAEVTSNIFLHCAPPSIGDDTGRPTQSRYTLQLMTIAAVCKTWRRTAFTTPKLWANVAISFSREKDQNSITFVEEWLSRSGALSLGLCLYASGIPVDPFTINANHEHYRCLLETIAKTSGRWQHLRLDLPGRMLQDLANIVTAAPALKSIKLDIWDFRYFEGDSFQFSLKGASPRHIDLSSILMPRHLDVDWRRATKIVAAFTIDELVRILQEVPELEALVIEHGYYPPEIDRASMESASTNIIVHTTLQSFAQRSKMLFTRAPCIRLPNLQHLTWNIHNSDSVLVLLEFIKYSTVALDSLEIQTERGLDYWSIAPCLYAVPSITRLKVLAFNDTFRMTEFFLDLAKCRSAGDSSLSNQAACPIFLPHLQSMELVNYECFSDQGTEIIIDGLRRTLGRPLKSCTIIHTTPYHSGTCGFMKDLPSRQIEEVIHADIDLQLYVGEDKKRQHNIFVGSQISSTKI